MSTEKTYPCKFHHLYERGCDFGDGCRNSHSDEPGDGPCQVPFCVINGKQFTHMAKRTN